MESKPEPIETIKIKVENNPTDIVLPEIQEKEERMRRNKRMFNSLLLVLSSLVGIIVLFYAIIEVSRFIKNRNTPTVIIPPATQPSINISSNWKDYNSDQIRLDIRYPENAKLIENKNYGGGIRNVEILYSPKDEQDLTEASLTEGFIVRITPMELVKNTLVEIADVKRESFSNDCGPNVSISNVRSDVVDNLEAKSFDVTSCNGDFKVTYTKKFGIYFEIIQLYRGSLGFRQQYKSTTEEMVNSLKFHPEEVKEEPPYKTFYDRYSKMEFKYPKNISEDCCKALNENFTETKIVTLGVKESEDKFAEFSIYYGNLVGGTSFDEFIQLRKNNFISDYKIVNEGREPTVIEEQMNIGGFFATRFKGLTWKGYDVIFVDATTDRQERYYFITVLNKIGPDFEKTLKDILASVTFGKQE